MIEIKNRYTDEVVKVVDAETLQYANLSEANLREANLRWANLREANLSEANLREANLRWANLREANLREADLRGADLRGANLRGAGLFVAQFDKWPVYVTRTQVSVGCQCFEYDKAIEGIKAVAPEYEVDGWRLENLLAIVQVGMDAVARMPEVQKEQS